MRFVPEMSLPKSIKQVRKGYLLVMALECGDAEPSTSVSLGDVFFRK